MVVCLVSDPGNICACDNPDMLVFFNFSQLRFSCLSLEIRSFISYRHQHTMVYE